jgi:MoaA/NifB/PqqE/SkfB family radical SAM enzyme
VEIRLGYGCNINCLFCYYRFDLHNADQDLSTKEAKKRLLKARKEGATEVEFTGGEPTIRKDLDELIKFAKHLGFINISMITNGIRLADPEFASTLISAGLNDIEFSLHGHTERLHDSLTATKGCFNKTVAAIRNVAQFPVRIRCNTVINGMNHSYAKDILKLLLQLRIHSITFVFFNPAGNSEFAEDGMFVRYSEAFRSVKEALDCFRNQLPLFHLKWIPFCMTQGYERYTMNLYQQSYDPDEWNIFMSYKVNHDCPKDNSIVKFNIALFCGLLFLRKHHFFHGFNWTAAKINSIAKIIQIVRKKRTKECKKCAYLEVCDYVRRTYLAKFGDEEIHAVQGPRVIDPIWCYNAPKTRAPGESVSMK